MPKGPNVAIFWLWFFLLKGSNKLPKQELHLSFWGMGATTTCSKILMTNMKVVLACKNYDWTYVGKYIQFDMLLQLVITGLNWL